MIQAGFTLLIAVVAYSMKCTRAIVIFFHRRALTLLSLSALLEVIAREQLTQVGFIAHTTQDMSFINTIGSYADLVCAMRTVQEVTTVVISGR